MAQRPLLKLNRDYVLATTKGHVISFAKDEPTHVPPAVYNDAIAIGAVPVDGTDPNVLVDPVEKAVVPLTVEERQTAIIATFAKIVETNNREDFTASGQPHFKAVSEILGYRVAGKDVAAAWQAYNEMKAE